MAQRIRSSHVGLYLLLGAVPLASGQEAREGPPATRTVVAGEEYDAGGLYRFLMGNDYRDLWTTPIEVEVLDLARRSPAGSRR